MVKRITSITEEQKAQFDGWNEKWFNIGFSTEPMDFERAKTACLKLYEAIEEKPPILVLSAPSPKEAIRIGTIESEKIKNPDIDPSKIDKDVFVQNSVYLYGGSSYALWGAFVTFFRDVMHWENDCLEVFHWAEELMHSCNWVWWSDEVCVIVDRPEILKVNDNKDLHCEDGPALRYRDGWSIYAWQGVIVPKEWIEDKENLDPTIALTWSNIEQRRCAAEIMGWDKVIDQLNATTIDDDGDPEIGVLLEVEIPDIGPERFLRVRCGTGRDFVLPVPPDMKTALQAQSWTWGMDIKDFVKPEIRT